MKTVSKKLFSLLLVAVLLVSVLPFQAFAAEAIYFHFYKYDFATSQYVWVSSQTKNVGYANFDGLEPALQVDGGWKFDGWVEYASGMSFEQVNSAPRISKHTPFERDVYLAATYVRDTASVEFVVNVNGIGADVAKPANINFFNNKAFAYTSNFVSVASLPNGYNFGGWKYGDTILTSENWGSVIFKSDVSTKLYAYWVPTNLTVTFHRWNDSLGAYEAIKAVTVPYGSTVKPTDIPSMDAVNSRDKYEPIGWQTSAGTDARAVEPTTAIIKDNTNFYARYLGEEVQITLNPGSAKLDTQTKTVRIGEKIGAYGGKLPTPSVTGYVFTGWADPSGNIVTDESIFWNSYSSLKATWAEQAKVYLEIKLDGKYYGGYYIPGGVQGGVLDLDNFNISKYLPAGKTYSVVYYDLAGRNDYEANKNSNPIDNVIVESSGTTMVYAYVTTVGNTNTNTNSGSNNTGSGTTTTTKPADPTNPATGDNSMIVASVTVMTLSAAALVVFMQLRKRKMI